MKKVVSVLLVAVALMMAVPAQAQMVKFGVKGGVNLSKLDFGVSDWNQFKESSTGFFIGPMAEVTLPILGLGFDGALMYSQRGGDAAKEQGIEIPINLKYTIGAGSVFAVYLAAGPDFFYNFNELDIEGIKTNKAQVAVNLGAGLKLLRKLQVGITYQVPVGDSFEIEDMGKVIGAKNKTWQVSMAYIF